MIKLLTFVIVLVGLASHASAGPLHDAAKDGDAEAVMALIADGEDVNKRDRFLGWPLHQAALNDFVEIAELLIAAGADVNSNHRALGTPLMAASQKGNVGVARLLLAQGADLEVRSENPGVTALHLAAASGNADLVAMLVAAGADVNARTIRANPHLGDYTPAHAAGFEGHFHIVALLGALGATSPPIEFIDASLATADAEAGKIAFGEEDNPGRCRYCHSVGGSADRKWGPNLQGVVGRDKAGDEGYEYSEALQRVGGVWTVSELNAFIAGPHDYVPGVHMEFWGISDPVERANIIAYLSIASE